MAPSTRCLWRCPTSSAASSSRSSSGPTIRATRSSYRWPDDDKEIKRDAQLIVRESQTVQFVYLGQYGDLFGPGKHSLSTDNIPILTRLKGWKYGFESPFKADVYFVITRCSPATSGARPTRSCCAIRTSASCGCALSGPTTSASSRRRSS